MRKALVLLPGMMCDRRLFEPQVTHLDDIADIFVGDITRHRSIRSIAAALLEEIPFDRFALCGLSMGGIVAMEIMRQAPLRVIGAALLDTTPLADADGRAEIRNRQIERAQKGELRRLFIEELLPHYLAGGNAGDGRLRQVLIDMAVELGPDVFENQSIALRDRANNESALADYGGSVLVLCGEEDAMCPPARHELIASHNPRSQLVTLAGVGHISTLEAPHAVNRALERWLADTPK
ncbi:MAG TPA: alpha/beta hydrolase [Ensifer sp.]|jgi:pimeloyl-ACP methyl ester carboxylesterase|uniref:alpha/beta fold hydrolase n=1 Tax=Ensifer sp. TaxID=1872086 RepID=UPI002E103453|nr:alpha/beta hydrolase [Ensifer sp.]